MDEQLLIDGCMRGESWARKELYEQYAPAMMSVCMRYVGDRETAREDIDIDLVDFFITGNVGVDLAAQFGIANEFFTVQADTAW